MTAEVVVIGGGLSGSAAAITLARAGKDVLLMEREREAQHKVCGEFLSREALRYLDQLGMHVTACGGVPIESVCLSYGRTVIEAKLPFHALSLTRRRLDEELLQRAEASGVRVLRGRRVNAIEHDDQGWRVFADAEAISGCAVFLATGKHDLRDRRRGEGKHPEMVAFKMYWRLLPRQVAALDGCVELILFPGGYAGLQLVEDGVANLCCLVRRTALQRLGGRWPNLLSVMQASSTLLRERLQGAEPLLEKPLAVSSIPYGFVRQTSDGIWSLGDQAAVIPSFTGDGMSIALHSGCLAAKMYLEGESAHAYQERLSSQLRTQVFLATMLSRGLVWPATRSAAVAAARLFPGLVKIVAEGTRITSAALPA